jgi:hypothetical protein
LLSRYEPLEKRGEPEKHQSDTYGKQIEQKRVIVARPRNARPTPRLPSGRCPQAKVVPEKIALTRPVTDSQARKSGAIRSQWFVGNFPGRPYRSHLHVKAIGTRGLNYDLVRPS